MDIETFRSIALSHEGVAEKPHFEKTSFRVKSKIFATLEIATGIACLKLNPEDQTQWCRIDRSIYPVDNHWGTKGWTYLNLAHLEEGIIVDVLTVAYQIVKNTRK